MNRCMNFNPEIENLIYNYLRGVITPEEQLRLDKWMNEKPTNRALFERICNRENILHKASFFERHLQEKVWERLEQKISKKKRMLFLNWKIAASLAIPLLVVGTLFLLQEGKNEKKEEYKGEIMSGVTCARLELSDGTVIALHQDSVYSMELSTGERLNNEGGIVFYGQDSMETTTTGYNEIRTPRGGEYQIQLPDGTKVWLNTESALRFPRVFASNERRVYASGELYFEVARDVARPFYVELDDYTVEVTGTKFNVRAYADEPRLTTLVSGGVSIRGMNETVHLNPGEEAIKEHRKGSNIRVQQADIESRLAWHRGYFLFDNARLEDIMNELGRWYNVEIFFEDPKAREKRFSLELRRHEKFLQVLDLIERAGMVEINVKKNVVFVR